LLFLNFQQNYDVTKAAANRIDIEPLNIDESAVLTGEILLSIGRITKFTDNFTKFTDFFWTGKNIV